MTIALDLGTRHIRSLRREEGRLFGRTNLAEYIALPDTPGHRRLLERAASSFGRCEDSLLVIGEASVELAETLQLPTIPLMPKGRLPVDDPLARQVLASLVDAVMPAARSKGQPCWMTIPGAIFEESESPERIFFSQLVRLKGFEPLVVSSGRSVILAELGANGFTGLGFDFGAGATRASLAYHGEEIACSVLNKGGHWIDMRLADSEDSVLYDSQGNRYLDFSAITRWKESKLVSVLNPLSEREQRLSLLYEELIGEMLAQLRADVVKQTSIAQLPQPLPLVCSGGVSRVSGFAGLVEEMLRDTMFPLEISHVRCATEADYTVARGSLILAELEETVITPARVA
ncbi:MAG: hypothetical protein KDA86_12875 [Planctomycetaceae bacterium]|nr:hypothetical protein [Planctomycetaceae bacterium]MCA9108496.1 hypothetical protein [Planctomycetaceae bacterium]